jgi:hypothetical protein
MGEETISFVQKDPDLPMLVAGWYSLIDETESALKYLNLAFIKGFCNYRFITDINHFYENIRNDVRFVEIVNKMKFEWENFEN